MTENHHHNEGNQQKRNKTTAGKRGKETEKENLDEEIKASYSLSG